MNKTKKFEIVLIYMADGKYVSIGCDYYFPDWLYHVSGHTELNIMTVDKENDKMISIPYHNILYIKQNYDVEESMKMFKDMMEEEMKLRKKSGDVSVG